MTSPQTGQRRSADPEFHVRIVHGPLRSAVDYYQPDIEFFIRAENQVEARLRAEQLYPPTHYSISGIDPAR